MLSSVDDLRVLLVAGDPLARAGLATLLADQPDFIVVGQGAGDADLPAEVAVYRPDVVVWDLGWDPAPALETSLERLTDSRDAGLSTVALLPDGTHAADVWTTDARGLLLRDVSVEPLLATLLAVTHGLVVLDPALTTGVLPTRDRTSESLIEELTPREVEVLELLADGLTNKAIAHQLGISEHTVKFHVNAILGKLGAQSRTDAVVRATRLGLILL
jgi:DNA-binding NarL/FixJ family response regulator